MSFDLNLIKKMKAHEISNLIKDKDLNDLFLEYDLDNFIEELKKDKRKSVNNIALKIEKMIEKKKHEVQRVKTMYNFDKSSGNYNFIAGVDEVGRGPLAGPIVACSVILDLNICDDELILGLNDSKKLSKKKREKLSAIIKEKAVSYSIAEVSAKDIDKKGIAYANNKVFLDSIDGLKKIPDMVLSDGYPVRNIKLLNKYVIKGDTKSASIAAASIVAKVYRDNLMEKYALAYKYYHFEHNAGYGTKEHIEAIKKYGLSDIHRKSFLKKICEDI
ncbi:ribonuclease HII [Clostridium sp. BJN0001]|uniref:ribonuclease HII n=1 Tax=Clostridium sp. BJN0001 TaxID=2930219 RepID=UPI001FD1690C|nr:ribonuclease HII [Clostridium sp. BJN0001]